MCFHNRKHADDFLLKIVLELAHDSHKYIGGMRGAELIGVTLETPFERMPSRKSMRAFLGMTPVFGEVL